jgi:multidrug efflux system outer membrane protein
MRKSLVLLALLSGCSLAPTVTPPDLALTPAFKTEAPSASDVRWTPATSRETEDRGAWWMMFGDPALDDLERQALAANQTLKAASARVDQARAAVRANGFGAPSVDVGVNAVQSEAPGSGPSPLYSAGVSVSYEVDLFQRLRNSQTAFRLDADAQAALYRHTVLALQADVAQTYFQLRALDAERVLLQGTVAIRREAQRIMQRRLDVGSVGATDVSRTESELAAATADLAALERQRATLENALAILLGQNPSGYRFADAPLADALPPFVPAGLPSELLLRRPDIASAQARMMAANRRIGVAKAAFFPSLMLTASGGFASSSLGDVFKWSNATWALGQTVGNALMATLFDNGRRAGRVAGAEASYAEALALYRQQVLVAMGDVENALSDQRLLADQVVALDRAAAATTRTTTLTRKRYDLGDASHFEVVDAQRAMLAANRAAIQARGQRQLAAIALVRALGGGWQKP